MKFDASKANYTGQQGGYKGPGQPTQQGSGSGGTHPSSSQGVHRPSGTPHVASAHRAVRCLGGLAPIPAESRFRRPFTRSSTLSSRPSLCPGVLFQQYAELGEGPTAANRASWAGLPHLGTRGSGTGLGGR